MLKTAGLFETPIFMAKIDDHKKWVDLARGERQAVEEGGDTYAFKDNDQCDQLRHAFELDKYHHNNNGESPKKWLNRPGWEPLREQIRQHLFEAYELYLGPDYMKGQRVIITDSWINVCDAGGFQFFHNHGNAMLSWTYFINLKPEEGHAQLAFNRPELSTRPFFAQPQEGSPYQHSYAIPDVSEGYMLIWPGHLTHGYKENLADGRMSMSGNSVPSVIRNAGYVLKVLEE